MPVEKMTQTFVKTVTCPAGKKRIWVSDTHTRGLVLEVRATGGRTYYLRYEDVRV
jgi:hypothetical protein